MKYNEIFDECDYVIFETEPCLLENIKADRSSYNWALADSQPTEGATFRYKFEKESQHAAPLSRIFEFATSMPRTANRTDHANVIIKVKDYGKRGNVNA